MKKDLAPLVDAARAAELGRFTIYPLGPEVVHLHQTGETATLPGHTVTAIPYIPDGSLAQLDDGVIGTVRHDLGGNRVPIYLLSNNSAYPHDYTSAERHAIAALAVPTSISNYTLHRNGTYDPHTGEAVWAQCDECNAQHPLTEHETPNTEIDAFLAAHPCTPTSPREHPQPQPRSTRETHTRLHRRHLQPGSRYRRRPRRHRPPQPQKRP